MLVMTSPRFAKKKVIPTQTRKFLVGFPHTKQANMNTHIFCAVRKTDGFVLAFGNPNEGTVNTAEYTNVNKQ